MKKIVTSWLWWLMPLILGLGKPRQRISLFKISLVCTASPRLPELQQQRRKEGGEAI